ncbi:hypothetical protein [Saccharothrix syringae]|uniref:Uncharacterized protein n=1 Tax=Saccharothrix syringae TaxID=103733 RepID=A0A5Q0H5X2_SACSY|nr:hypothetical protein [Saccharothrix syringae]QFZ21142.1 hypothetical protein EKG83_30495 [Saccharothrix syringae]
MAGGVFLLSGVVSALHLFSARAPKRGTAGWKGGPAAWINVAGLVVVLVDLFFVDLVAVGLRSYAGIE